MWLRPLQQQPLLPRPLLQCAPGSQRLLQVLFCPRPSARAPTPLPQYLTGVQQQESSSQAASVLPLLQPRMVMSLAGPARRAMQMVAPLQQQPVLAAGTAALAQVPVLLQRPAA